MIQNLSAEGGAFRLPPAAYLDATWLEREIERVFETNWSLVAAVDELPDLGDALDVSVGRYELVIVRTAEGWRAFHNTCRHRGMALVDGPMQTGERLRCPYHGWEFSSTDGSLVRLPQRTSQFAECDLAGLGLRPAAVAEWEGMLFAHPDPDPPSFDALVTEFAAGIGSFRPGLLEQVAHVSIDVACNWKLFVENHIDVYHLWYLHAVTLGDFDHARFEHREIGPNWVSYEPLRRSSPVPAGRTIEHLAPRDREGIGAHLLFPNMTMASTAEYFITYSVIPVDPGSSRIDLRVRAEDPARADELVAIVRAFIDEDIEACERIQQALRSPRFDVGPLARTHEQTIVRFHDQLLARLGSTAVAPPVRRSVPA